MIVDDIQPVISKFDSNEWRNTYICKEVDAMFKKYLPILNATFNNYSKKYVLPG